MKRIICLISLALFFCLNAMSEEVSIREFKLPETKSDNMNLYLDLNYSGTDSMNFIGDFSLQYSKFYSSLPFSYYLYSELSNDGDFTTRFYENGKKTVYDRLSFVIVSSLEKYWSDESMFFLGGKFSTNFGSNVNYSEHLGSITNESNLGIGGGYGRTYDASGMAEALRIQEYLLSENLISDEFSKEIILDIAVHCTKINEYAQKYYAKHPINWYQDLEQILIRSGKLNSQNLNPYALFRVSEVLNRERIHQKIIGWKLGAYFAFSNYTYFYDTYFYDKYYDENDYDYNYPNTEKIGGDLNFEIGYPINNKLHFYHNTTYSYKVDTDFLDESQNIINTNSSLTYNFTNLFDFEIKHQLRTYNVIKSTVSEQKLTFDAYYYLENNVFLRLSMGLNNYTSDYGNPKRDYIKKEIALYFGYRFF